MTSKEKPAARSALCPQDQRAFARWQRLFSRPQLFSTTDPPPSPSPPDPAAAPHHPHVDRSKLDAQTKDCMRVVNHLYRSSPIIIFLNSELQKLGCNPPIYCQHCDQRWRGGFSSTAGIMLCQNQMGDERRVESTLAHEMIHAFDHCRFKFDVHNLRHIACSEVRAVALSRECRFLDELRLWFRAKRHGSDEEFGFYRRMQTCVRRRAVMSLMQHESQPTEKEAKRIVDQVFDNCFRDTRPFDELY